MVVLVSARTRVGLYRAQTGAHLVLAAADTSTVGRWWLINPVGSTVAVSVKKVVFSSQLGSASVATTSPRIQIERTSFTGTASGAQITPAKRVRTTVAGLTADAAPSATVRTASTGLTLTAGEAVEAWLPISAATGAGYVATGTAVWECNLEDEELILAAGEGIVCRQADAGSAGDTRRFVTTVTWEEFTAP